MTFNLFESIIIISEFHEKESKMTVTFFGHSTVTDFTDIKELLYQTVKNLIAGEDKVVFYLGGYGDFDNMAARVCRELKSEHKQVEVVFVTPYLTPSQQKKIREMEECCLYDSSVYPPLENIPPRLAIIKRNEWMADNADVILAYVKYSHGGAFRALTYAQRKGKKIINLA